jgi:hypothetical protein
LERGGHDARRGVNVDGNGAILLLLLLLLTVIFVGPKDKFGKLQGRPGEVPARLLFAVVGNVAIFLPFGPGLFFSNFTLN